MGPLSAALIVLVVPAVVLLSILAMVGLFVAGMALAGERVTLVRRGLVTPLPIPDWTFVEHPG